MSIDQILISEAEIQGFAYSVFGHQVLPMSQPWMYLVRTCAHAEINKLSLCFKSRGKRRVEL